MIEPSQRGMIGLEEEKQPETREGAPVAEHQDTTPNIVSNGTSDRGRTSEPADQVNETSPEVSPAGVAEASVNRSETLNQHAEAGRKGARRIHQLLQQGRLYEQEHGLKPGRQRLRQLIQEGKLYEQEHGLRGGGKRTRDERRPRTSNEQVLKTFFQSLFRLAKPAFRTRILAMIEALEGESQ